jgi:hypothetical protein
MRTNRQRLACLAYAIAGFAVAVCSCSPTAAQSSAGQSGNGGGGGSGTIDSGTPAGVSQEGGTCATANTLRCGLDVTGRASNAVLLCSGAIFSKVFQCPGLEACANIQGHDQVRCGGSGSGASGDGTYFAATDLPCVTEGAQSCSFDQTTVLRCSKGSWATAVHCAPSACQNLPIGDGTSCSGTWCANCGYTMGDMCDFSAGGVLCSTDLGAIVQCTDGQVTLYETCSPKTCARTSAAVPSIACM